MLFGENYGKYLILSLTKRHQMIDGILCGLFGPAIASWLSRFKYWVIFIVAMLLTQAVTVVCMFRYFGFQKTVDTFAIV